jgi:hypothetical protein
MNNNMGLFLILGGLAIVVMVVALGWLFMRANRVNLTGTKEGEKPEWMRSTPPRETLAATQADGEGVTLYDHDAGEKLAAPFAEQIEDILQNLIEADPQLKKYKLDFGTASDGGLEIWVDGKPYRAIKDIPEEPIRAAIQKAIDIYNK